MAMAGMGRVHKPSNQGTKSTPWSTRGRRRALESFIGHGITRRPALRTPGTRRVRGVLAGAVSIIELTGLKGRDLLDCPVAALQAYKY